ncbi:hypothetical protein LTR56_012685 [Elasticomyces elasticus]|nr:hypothetical protein LTR56_012685 [Elasticomyces elasticus]KAK5769417.1 hypothetical protein LTS12_000344 [Elasticomyces elasticus]
MFVTSGFANWDDGPLGWLGGATGMISLMANITTFGAVRKAYLPNDSQNAEQASTGRFIWTTVSILTQLAVSVILMLLARFISSGSTHIYSIRVVAVLAALLCVTAAIYDAARLYKERDERFDDEYLDNEYLDNDATEQNFEQRGSVRLE